MDKSFKETRETDVEFLTRLDRLDKIAAELEDRIDLIEKDKKFKVIRRMC